MPATCAPHSPSDVQPGDHVICDYRLPPELQPWIGTVWVGQVMQPGDDPADWNGHNSERVYCEQSGLVPVAWPFGVMHDDPGKLRRVDARLADLPHNVRVRIVLGDEVANRLT